MASDLTPVETFHGAEFQPGAVDPSWALEHAEAILELRDLDVNRELFYHPVIHGMKLTNIDKAWIEHDAGYVTVGHTMFDVIRGEHGRRRELALKIKRFSDALAHTTGFMCSMSTVQIYTPSHGMPVHVDHGHITDLFTLSGKGKFFTYTDEDEVIDTIEVKPGDRVRSDSITKHSVMNTSETEPRVMLGHVMRVRRPVRIRRQVLA